MDRAIARRTPSRGYGVARAAYVTNVVVIVDNGVDAGFARKWIKNQLCERASAVSVQP
jgi:hypothetical protein